MLKIRVVSDAELDVSQMFVPLASDGVDLSIVDFYKYLPTEIETLVDEASTNDPLKDQMVVIFGVGDGGVNIAEIIDSVLAIRDFGIGILLAHDTPNNIVEIDRIINETPEEYEERKNVYQTELLGKLANLGVADLIQSYDFKIVSKAKVADTKNSVFSQPYDMTSLISNDGIMEIQPTHNTGVVLRKDCVIVATLETGVTTLDNYYVALFEEAGKGRVALTAMGHNNYGSDVLYQVTQFEVAAGFNLISWLAGM